VRGFILNKEGIMRVATTKQNRVGQLAPPATKPVIEGRFSFKAYQTLYFGFIALPIIAGADKFFDFITTWSIYLSPVVSGMVDAQMFMRAVGVIEIAAGLLVAFRPKIGAFVVAAWLGGIIVNLLSYPGFYDVALRDFGLALGALALGFLAKEYTID
jgi:hypothetical protein